MNDSAYKGFAPLTYEAAMSVRHDREAVEVLVSAARRFMLEEAPRMAVLGGLLPNPYRSIDVETIEEGMGDYAHRILISKRLNASFVVMPKTLKSTDADSFLGHVSPDKNHLVIAACAYESGFRTAMQGKWRGNLTLLTFAGTEKNHGYELHLDS